MAKDKEMFKLYHVRSYPFGLAVENAYEAGTQYRIPWRATREGREHYNLVPKSDPSYSKEPRAAIEAYVAAKQQQVAYAQDTLRRAESHLEEAELLLRDFDAGLVTPEDD